MKNETRAHFHSKKYFNILLSLLRLWLRYDVKWIAFGTMNDAWKKINKNSCSSRMRRGKKRRFPKRPICIPTYAHMNESPSSKCPANGNEIAGRMINRRNFIDIFAVLHIDERALTSALPEISNQTCERKWDEAERILVTKTRKQQ